MIRRAAVLVLPAVCLVVFGAAAAFAQWTPYVPPGVPKTADGKPDFSAPAPRTADGKPDLSGIWENAPMGIGRPAAAPADQPPLASFFDVGANIKGGLPFQPWAAEVRKKRQADNDKDNPDAHCLPMGLLQFHEHPQPRKIVQTSAVIVIIYEANYGLRQIFLDGRTRPGADAQPWWYGYSVGRWDGDTLVVETTGLRDDGWLDIVGSPQTEAATITERFQRVNYGTLIVDVTIDDPKAYTKPFTVRFNQHLSPDAELIEFICNENERSAAHLLGKSDTPVSRRYAVDPKLFDGYVGRYQAGPGQAISITRKDSQLFGQIGELPPFELFASSDRDFYLNAFDARLTFEVDASGRATALVMHTDTDRRAPRVD